MRKRGRRQGGGDVGWEETAPTDSIFSFNSTAHKSSTRHYILSSLCTAHKQSLTHCTAKLCNANNALHRFHLQPLEDWKCSRQHTKVSAPSAFHLPLHSKQLRCASEHHCNKRKPLLVPESSFPSICAQHCRSSPESGTKCTLEEVNENNCLLELNIKRDGGCMRGGHATVLHGVHFRAEQNSMYCNEHAVEFDKGCH